MMKSGKAEVIKSLEISKRANFWEMLGEEWVTD